MTEEVVTKARSALAKSPIHVLHDVHIERQGDSLVLSGRVDSYYHKQLAQEVVRAIARDVHVVNTLDVDYGDAARLT